MSGSLNEATLIGNLCADPETRKTQTGAPVCSLRIATNETWKDKNTGERRERAEYHKVVIFNEGLCRVADSYLRKGSKVFVRGQIQTRKWTDQSGAERYATEIVLQGFNAVLTLLDSRKDDGGRDEPARGGAGPIDDDIPFAPEVR